MLKDWRSSEVPCPAHAPAFFYGTWHTSFSFLSESHQADGSGAYYTVLTASTFYRTLVCQSFLKRPASSLPPSVKVRLRDEARKWGVHVNPGCTGNGEQQALVPAADRPPPEPPAVTKSISEHPSCSLHWGDRNDTQPPYYTPFSSKTLDQW